MECKDDKLRNAAIAAFTKGTQAEKNIALSGCVKLNSDAIAKKNTDSRVRLFDRWVGYFVTNPVK